MSIDHENLEGMLLCSRSPPKNFIKASHKLSTNMPSNPVKDLV